MLVVEDRLSRSNPSPLEESAVWISLCGSCSDCYLRPFTFYGRRVSSRPCSRKESHHHAVKVNGPGRYKPRQHSKSEEKRGKTFELKLCDFVTVLSYIANMVFEASRADPVYLVLNRIGKEVCSLLFANETH